MNNQQFRRLVLDTPARSQNEAHSPPKATAAGAFGSRSRSSIPMTPRNFRGSVERNFARQLAERNAADKKTKPSSSSASAPKGTKLAAGYHDRTKDRRDDRDDGADDRGRRIRALEEQLKLEQIDRRTFESLRDEITGGDVGATHLVKGLDRRLLERVRRGEDVMADTSRQGQEEQQRQNGGQDEDAAGEVDEEEEEFEALERRQIAPVAREAVVKKGEMAAPPPGALAGGKRKRDAILAELKASRRAAAEAAAAAQPQLGSRFRRIGDEPRVEIDAQGREVLIVVGADGKVKRKVRRAARGDAAGDKDALLQPDRAAAPLGIADADLPQARAQKPTEDEDDDIFEGVGAEYDPLAGLDDDDDDNDDEDVSAAEEGKFNDRVGQHQTPEPPDDLAARISKPPNAPGERRNYFRDDGAASAPSSSVFDKPDDAAILATLKKASRIATGADDASPAGGRADEAAARLKRRAAMLDTRDRDMDDVDVGFGSSRFGDAEDGEGADERVKLSEWKGGVGGREGDDDDGDDDGLGERGGKKRKRGPKKRKGDKNSAADVMRAVEQQRKQVA